MTRLEMLKWCFENISHPDNNYTRNEVLNVIGGSYLEELEQMGFVLRWYDWAKDCHRVHLTWLGNVYCEEIFN